MIIRREKNKNYSIISNECLKNPKISSRARAMYAFIMTLPDDWNLSKKNFILIFQRVEIILTKVLMNLKNGDILTRIGSKMI